MKKYLSFTFLLAACLLNHESIVLANIANDAIKFAISSLAGGMLYDVVKELVAEPTNENLETAKGELETIESEINTAKNHGNYGSIEEVNIAEDLLKKYKELLLIADKVLSNTESIKELDKNFTSLERSIDRIQQQMKQIEDKVRNQDERIHALEMEIYSKPICYPVDNICRQYPCDDPRFFHVEYCYDYQSGCCINKQ